MKLVETMGLLGILYKEKYKVCSFFSVQLMLLIEERRKEGGRIERKPRVLHLLIHIPFVHNLDQFDCDLVFVTALEFILDVCTFDDNL